MFVRWVHHRVTAVQPQELPSPTPTRTPPPLSWAKSTGDKQEQNHHQQHHNQKQQAAPSTGNSLVSTNRPPAYYYVYLYLPSSKLLSYLTLSLSCSQPPSFINSITRTVTIARSETSSLIFPPPSTTFAHIFPDVPARRPEQWLESMLMYFPFISYPPTSTLQSSWFSTLKILGRVGDRNGFVVRGGGENLLPSPPRMC